MIYWRRVNGRERMIIMLTGLNVVTDSVGSRYKNKMKELNLSRMQKLSIVSLDVVTCRLIYLFESFFFLQMLNIKSSICIHNTTSVELYLLNSSLSMTSCHLIIPFVLRPNLLGRLNRVSSQIKFVSNSLFFYLQI